jgi:hypothetical protein
VAHYKPVPDKKHDECANHRANETGALVWAVPADCLADERRDKSADNTEQGGENKTRGIVRSGCQKPGNNAGDESDNDDP